MGGSSVISSTTSTKNRDKSIIMGLMDAPPEEWMSRLSLALKVEAVLFMTFWFLAYTVKFGMVWHEGAGAPFQPPFFKFDSPATWLFNMILAVYAVLGFYMFKAADKPAENKAFIGFWIWGALVAHLIILILTVLLDDTPVFDGTESFLGMALPQRMMGIAHWPNVSPVGDVWLLVIFSSLDIFLVKKVFGTMLAPWEM